MGPGSRRRYGAYLDHVAAVTLHDMAAPFADAEPDQAGAVLFGARVIDHVERRFSQHLLDAWSRDESSLRIPVEDRVAVVRCA